MNYQTFQPHQHLEPLVKCYWTLKIFAEKNSERQRIVPDGCIEMAFILGDDIKRYTSENDFILQPRAMILGQTIEPFYIEPTGYVNTFAVRFYPYGFANFVPNSETVNVVLAKGSDYKPTSDGALLYLNAGNDLQPTLDKIKKNGGQVIVPKTKINPEMGFFALFINTEGNKLGLHSTQ